MGERGQEDAIIAMELAPRDEKRRHGLYFKGEEGWMA